MPEKIAKVVEIRIKRLETGFEELHSKMDKHLLQSGEVLTNIEWLKRLQWGLFGITVTILVSILIAILKHAVTFAGN